MPLCPPPWSVALSVDSTACPALLHHYSISSALSLSSSVFCFACRNAAFTFLSLFPHLCLSGLDPLCLSISLLLSCVCVSLSLSVCLCAKLSLLSLPFPPSVAMYVSLFLSLASAVSTLFIANISMPLWLRLSLSTRSISSCLSLCRGQCAPPSFPFLFSLFRSLFLSLLELATDKHAYLSEASWSSHSTQRTCTAGAAIAPFGRRRKLVNEPLTSLFSPLLKTSRVFWQIIRYFQYQSRIFHNIMSYLRRSPYIRRGKIKRIEGGTSSCCALVFFLSLLSVARPLALSHYMRPLSLFRLLFYVTSLPFLSLYSLSEL